MGLLKPLLGSGALVALWLISHPAAAADISRFDHVIGTCLVHAMPRVTADGTIRPRRKLALEATGLECRALRGDAEFVPYNSARLDLAFEAWRAQADRGDAESQYILAEMYERGWGTRANPKRALNWYKQAANQGHQAAAFNVAKMYELGMGTPKDLQRARIWRRPPVQNNVTNVAAAIPPPEPAVPGAPSIRLLEPELEFGDIETRGVAVVSSAATSRIAAITFRVNSDSLPLRVTVNGNVLLPTQPGLYSTTLRIDNQGTEIRILATDAAARRNEVVFAYRHVPNIGYGKYFALIIANQNYAAMSDLSTPFEDAAAVAHLLEHDYGFMVFPTMKNATRQQVLDRLNTLRSELGPTDNLLIYYAGHGHMDHDTREGIWLPVDANPDVTTNHITSHDLSGLLRKLHARGVLIVSDSCFAGSLARIRTRQADDVSLNVRINRARRVRAVLAAGGDEPVLDFGDHGSGPPLHSVFAREFLAALRDNRRVLDARELLLRIEDPVVEAANRSDVIQVPVYKPLDGAGHADGAFYFVPLAVLTQPTQEDLTSHRLLGPYPVLPTTAASRYTGADEITLWSALYKPRASRLIVGDAFLGYTRHTRQTAR
ncbi:MAG: caspase family protein [Pseudomonadota bacterium]